MPSLEMYKISPPSDYAEFERICMDYLERKYEADASVFGRKGQAQKGVDIIVTLKDNNYVCAQCKDVKKATVSDLEMWISKTDLECKIPMREFVIIVGFENDARLQESVCLISKNRRDEHKPPVKLYFWDDVVHFIKKDPNMLRMYYPELYVGQVVKLEAAMKSPEIQYPERITFSARLRNLFFDETVKYSVEEFLDSDPISGVDSTLIGMADACIYSIRSLLYRSPMLSSDDCYYDIQQFLKCFNEYCDFFSRVSEVRGNKVFATIKYGTKEERDDVDYNEKLRAIALEKYNELKNY